MRRYRFGWFAAFVTVVHLGAVSVLAGVAFVGGDGEGLWWLVIRDAPPLPVSPGGW
ncbi:hypothetical protein [Nonomuraea gerenzanensis]|uniref:Uncharacterized protein n=1 Tax=Nonomuraea gerenzanensis TaxID=93944 RepID=A0A1M4EH80_9ACTN|nr:hypothetical protein [Nonomuraea gerenzanensis]UBU09870.1 hypothetical protein LCN96_36700 [Nonomuraea gerenzanensis]SBO98321.1 hypothetical protein BN4615_P7837 [Nonomuraea gerenzanensis]